MTDLGYDRYRAALATESDLLRAAVADADLSTRVPTCPDWTLADLLRHVGRAHRWAESLIVARATEYVEDERPASAGPDGSDPRAMDAWLAEGAAMLDAALAEAGPTAPVWTWGQEQSPAFWARRMTHETVIHRADAVSATGTEYAVAPDVAADAVDEWLEIVTNPLAAHFNPKLGELRGTGQAIGLRATDTAPEQAGHWTIELTPEGVRWARAQSAAEVTASGALTDLALLFYRRLPRDTDRVRITGDRALLDFWLDRASFE
ncbi:maleylpyruvate isomerase N-terminal domain-containing protein [Streptomyces sp. 71268]|uniref:maleylpyruvate isomerase N-terminal domain-containing protein n=1 Tax=Streptomyces sp. 71268 TaxID=3002640 RepID=UPI0023F919E5|nr:maleylpyruvate isomerase N-terminal domain-containing protein [Streptomyces sp. 71268]WEV28111.1 maleylpyruvate isomerase N-terminal domain-containing protein [Streptomyces sp. 71268]